MAMEKFKEIYEKRHEYAKDWKEKMMEKLLVTFALMFQKNYSMLQIYCQ